MRFIDLFAGLGGFHVALGRLGHTCVFASEIDECLRDVYFRNFQLMPAGDIRTIDAADIPEHEILCAGFPCQSFSKAGPQSGFEHPDSGSLLDDVIRIIRHHRPRYIILENVANIEKHDQGATWDGILSQMRHAGYDVRFKRLSPHQFGIPQIRERMFLLGSHSLLDGFDWPQEVPGAPLNITDLLDENPADARQLSAQVVQCLNAWQAFLHQFPADEQLPSFPIWSMEFGATYPYEGTTPLAIGAQALQQYRGSHGRPLNGLSPEEVWSALPSYAKRDKESEGFPRWKTRFIQQNRDFYARHQAWIDEWMPQILPFPASLQKFEWNCRGEVRDIWQLVIQFRASGVRVKRPTTSPSLIAMNTTQVPIIGWQHRYLTPRECARLQSLREVEHLPTVPSRAYGALGNAVNADLVEMIARKLFHISPVRTQLEVEIRQAMPA